MKTNVVFRKFKDSGDIIALFPNESWNIQSGTCSSYMRIGQPGGSDYSGCIKTSNPAKPKEYQNLLNELKRIGYDLNIQLRKGK